MMYHIFSVIGFSHENLSDYEQNDGLNFRYTDATFKCKSLKIPRLKKKKYKEIKKKKKKNIVASLSGLWCFRFSSFFSVNCDLKHL